MIDDTHQDQASKRSLLSKDSIERGKDISRRKFLAGSALLIVLSSTGLILPPSYAEEPHAPEDPMHVPGTLPRPYGDRSSFEKATRLGGAGPGTPHGWGANAPNNFNSLTPLQDLHGIIMPASLHFERHHNGVPLIDPTRHRLLIHGLVKRPMIFTVDDLERFPAVSRVAFLECSGNTWDGWSEAKDFSVQDTYGLTSTSEWTGVKLATLLETVGVQPEATWMLAEGSDAAGLDRSVPLTNEVLQEAMICYVQNGEALRPEQGYPLRLFLPGWEGNINVKWLRRLKLGSVYDALGDGQVHGSHAGWQSLSIDAGDGSEVRHYLSLWATANSSGLPGDSRVGMERPRKSREGRGERGCRTDVAGSAASGARPSEMPHPLPVAMAMERAGSDPPKPMHR